MTISEKITDILCDDPSLGDMAIVSGGNQDILPFPLPCPYIAVSDGQAKGEYLTGTNAPLITPTVIVSVLVPESAGAGYCRECAEQVCIAVTDGDEERLITSVSVSPCSFSDENMAWKYDIVFGIREETL